MRRVACLHTADSNIAIFDAAARGLDVSLRHVVRSDLLAEKLTHWRTSSSIFLPFVPILISKHAMV